jgi:hypothetical protein
MPSVDDIIKDREKYHQKNVCIDGILIFERENIALYPDLERLLPEYGVWLANPEVVNGLKKTKIMHKARVIVSGTFLNCSKRGTGHFNRWQCRLTNIKSLDIFS